MEIKTTIQSYLLIYSYIYYSMFCYAQYKKHRIGERLRYIKKERALNKTRSYLFRSFLIHSE